jgi:hypothetical protein
VDRFVNCTDDTPPGTSLTCVQQVCLGGDGHWALGV